MADTGGATRLSTTVRLEREMCPALQQACQEVQRLFGRNEARDAYDRYLIGCIIRDVRNAEHTYGQGSVGKIARAVGRDVDTLYQYGDVAEAWSQAEVTRLLGRKTALGLPLSFSHLVELSKVRHDRDLLKALTERAFAGISVRHLRALVEEQRRRSPRVEADAPFNRLRRIVRRYDHVLGTARALADCLAELPRLDSTPKLEELLQQALVKQAELRRACDQSLKRLETEHARVRSDLGHAVGTISDGTVTPLPISETSRKYRL